MKFFLIFLFVSYAIALDKDWWRHSIMYEIYTPSFKDTNGDGWGDLKGILSKLDYLKDLGVDTLYLTPIHPSPMLDTGYDVSDYLEINPIFGTMADFDKLMREMKKRDIKLIMDFVINHSSDQHEWFKKSVDRIEPYANYYVWKNSKGYNETGHPIPPNNWCTVFMTQAWTWNEKRQQFYYHSFLPEQPDLNYRNPHVFQEIKKIIKFWLNKGVAGMRLDASDRLMEDPTFADEEPWDPANKGKNVRCWDLKQEKVTHGSGAIQLIHEIRTYVDQLSAEADTIEKIVILEVFGNKEQLLAYQGNSTYPGAHYPFNYMFLQFLCHTTSSLNHTIDYWMSITPNHTSPNWLIDNHDRFRPLPFYIQEYVNVLLTIITTLPGITVIYYGDEIGMTSGVIRPHQRRLFSEYGRTPMQWDASNSAGFSSKSRTWLPTNPNYWRLNVEKQKSNPQSVYNFLRNLLTLKKTETMKYGSFEKFIWNDSTFIIKRSYKNNNETYIVVLNLGTERETINLDAQILNLPHTLRVCVATPNLSLKKGTVVCGRKRRSFLMKPMSAIVLSQHTLKNKIEDEFNDENDLITN